jgi:esterase/lipase superfamily enzyme/DNA-binding SARP family transcriptional activator
MSFRRLAATVFAISLAFGVRAIAPAGAQQPDELSTLGQQIGPLFQKGDYEKATVLAEQYADLAKAKYGDASPGYASALSWLAAIAQDRGRYDVAETHYKRILEIDETALGQEHADVGRDCNNLALLYQDMGRYAEAEGLYDRSLVITEKALGPDHLTFATRLHNKGALLRLQGRYGDSETALLRALAIREKSPDAPPRDVGKSLSNLGRLSLDMARYADSEAYHRRALAIFEKEFGPDNVRTAFSLHDLANLYQAVGQYAEAERLIERALAIRSNRLGREHAAVARSLYVLAGIHEKQGRIDDALTEYKRALAIQESALGPDRPDVAATKVSLAVLYKSQARYDEAQTLLESAVGIQEKSLAPDHPALASSLLPLSEIYRRQGRRDDAERLFKRARAIRKSSLTEVPVFFATNRKRDPDAKGIEFGTEGDPQLTLGNASLSILKDDAATAVPSASVKKVEEEDSITDVARISIPRLEVQDESDVINAARRQLQSSQAFKNQALVFVHGYNVDFDNAVRRAGQIAYDLQFDGPIFLFSWPSRQRYLDYFTDRETVDIAIEQLKGLLQRIVVPIGAAKVHLVAHSMGNLVLLRALSDLSEFEPSRRPVIGEIIDAAPDVAPEVFAQYAAKIRNGGGNLTVYASAADKALWFSKWLWGRPRVGYITTDGPSLIAGVDLIDITSAGMAIFAINHDVYAASPVVVSDMRRIIVGERPPDKRTKEFSQVDAEGGKYWIFRALEETAGTAD